MFDNEEERQQQFPITRKRHYFSHAAVGPLPAYVHQAATAFLQAHADLGDAHWRTTGPLMETVRATLAEMLRVQTHEIAFTRNVSEGISLLASGLDWKPGDNVVLSDLEFPANVYPWMNLDKFGVETRFCRCPGQKFSLTELREKIDERTRVVSVSSVQFLNGFRPDLQAIGHFCRQAGIVFCVDAIQQLGAIPLDMARDQIDFLACGGHKWLMSGEGIGFVACTTNLAETLRPTNVGWQGVKQWEDPFDRRFDYKPGALRFETGTVSAIGIHCLNASLKGIARFGPDNIAQQVRENSAFLLREIRQRSFETITDDSFVSRKTDPASGTLAAGESLEARLSGIVSFRLPGVAATRVQEFLESQQISVTIRGGYIRLAPHFYNTRQELARLFELLDQEF
jgi:selenocysteine lyase/cysteine desulfurase